MALSKGLRFLCCAIVAVTLLAILCVVLIFGKSSPISVTGDEAHVQEVNQVKTPLIEINNRVNFSSLGLGAVLLLVFFIIMARALHHMVVKRHGKVVKREKKIDFENRVEKLEEFLKARGYLS